MKILIAEDEKISRMVLEASLKKHGHEVVAVENGRKAWEVFQKENFPEVRVAGQGACQQGPQQNRDFLPASHPPNRRTQIRWLPLNPAAKLFGGMSRF